MSKWYGLGSVPHDGREVLLWVPSQEDSPRFDIADGEVVIARYDSALDCYYDSSGCSYSPICWREVPNGPSSLADISFEADEAS
jgi:hypothetical protein